MAFKASGNPGSSIMASKNPSFSAGFQTPQIGLITNSHCDLRLRQPEPRRASNLIKKFCHNTCDCPRLRRYTGVRTPAHFCMGRWPRKLRLRHCVRRRRRLRLLLRVAHVVPSIHCDVSVIAVFLLEEWDQDIPPFACASDSITRLSAQVCASAKRH